MSVAGHLAHGRRRVAASPRLWSHQPSWRTRRARGSFVQALPSS